MKPRKVSISLEVETNLPIKVLRNGVWWQDGMYDPEFTSPDLYGGQEFEPKVLRVQVKTIKPSR